MHKTRKKRTKQRGARSPSADISLHALYDLKEMGQRSGLWTSRDEHNEEDIRRAKRPSADKVLPGVASDNFYHEVAMEKTKKADSLQREWQEAVGRAEEEERMLQKLENKAKELKEELETTRQEAERATAFAKEWTKSMAVATEEFQRRKKEQEDAESVVAKKRRASEEAASVIEQIRDYRGGYDV